MIRIPTDILDQLSQLERLAADMRAGDDKRDHPEIVQWIYNNQDWIFTTVRMGIAHIHNDAENGIAREAAVQAGQDTAIDEASRFAPTGLKFQLRDTVRVALGRPESNRKEAEKISRPLDDATCPCGNITTDQTADDVWLCRTCYVAALETTLKEKDIYIVSAAHEYANEMILLREHLLAAVCTCDSEDNTNPEEHDSRCSYPCRLENIATRMKKGT